MRVIVISIFICMTVASVAQTSFDSTKLSSGTKQIVKSLQTSNIVWIWAPSSEPVFQTCSIKSSFNNIPVTIEEMRTLTDHHHPVVRSYAFKALTELSEPDAFEVIVRHLNDSLMINTGFGCFRHTESVGDVFVSFYLRQHKAPLHHRRTLDSLIVVTPNKLDCRGEAAVRLGADETYYQSIRDLALRDGLFKALVALARFKNEADVEAILNAEIKDRPFKADPLSSRLFIIRQFPHPYFISFVEQHLNRELSNEPSHTSEYVYEALVNFSGAQVRKLLLRSFEIQNPARRMQHLEQLASVLESNTNPEFADIRKRLRSEKLD